MNKIQCRKENTLAEPPVPFVQDMEMAEGCSLVVDKSPKSSNLWNIWFPKLYKAVINPATIKQRYMAAMAVMVKLAKKGVIPPLGPPTNVKPWRTRTPRELMQTVGGLLTPQRYPFKLTASVANVFFIGL